MKHESKRGKNVDKKNRRETERTWRTCMRRINKHEATRKRHYCDNKIREDTRDILNLFVHQETMEA